MKTPEDALRVAMYESLGIFVQPSNTETTIVQFAHLIAALEVYTDATFTEEQQSRLFNLSAQRIKALKGEE